MDTAIGIVSNLRRAYNDWALSEKLRQSKQTQRLNWARVMDLQKQVKALVKTMSTEDCAEFNAKVVADGNDGLLRIG